jgi:hypothetical protein
MYLDIPVLEFLHWTPFKQFFEIALDLSYFNSLLIRNLVFIKKVSGGKLIMFQSFVINGSPEELSLWPKSSRTHQSPSRGLPHLLPGCVELGPMQAISVLHSKPTVFQV